MEDFVERFVTGKRVLLHPADDAWFDSFSWSLNRKGYVKTNVKKNGRWTTDYLARMITDAPKGMVVDHINGDIYDNRRENLRVCSNAQNLRNTRKKKSSSGGFKGVYKRGERFRACIRSDWELIHLGTFDTAKEAAEAYNKAAIKYFGEFAYLNKIE